MPKIVKDKDVYKAAMKVVMERGYIGAATKQIADIAGISEVTLFRKYGSKAELIKQSMVAHAEQTYLNAPAQYTGNLASDLLQVVENYQDSVQENGMYIITILMEIKRYPELTDLLDIPFNLMGGIGELLARYQNEGLLVQEHPLNAVSGLLGPLIVTNMFHGISNNAQLPEIDLQDHVQKFLDGRSPILN